LAGTDCVELIAVMARYNPFAEKAGMKRIAEQAPPKEAVRIVGLLHELGFNEQLLGSEKYVLEKLQSLSSQDVERIKQALVKHSHPRFMKAFSYHLPYGLKQTYINRAFDFAEACTSDKDLRIPDADKGLSLLDRAILSLAGIAVIEQNVNATRIFYPFYSSGITHVAKNFPSDASRLKRRTILCELDGMS